MALGLTQPLTEMNTRNISWVKGRGCVGLTTLPSSCAYCLEIWEPQTLGSLRACPRLQWGCFNFRFKLERTNCNFLARLPWNLSLLEDFKLEMLYCMKPWTVCVSASDVNRICLKR